MKKTIILFTVMIGTQTFASNWGHSSFPNNNPYFTSTSVYDINNEVKMDFSCSKDFKNVLILNMKNMKFTVPNGEVVITESDFDKKSVTIVGKYEVEEDNTVSLILPENKNELLKEFKSLNGVVLTFKNDGKTIETVKYNLKGSSKALNLFENKCQKLK